MAVLKCKMCGGVLNIASGATIAECEYCGSVQTLPRVCDERIATLHERAYELRANYEFDKALENYEKILDENPSDADVYWSMLLCEYGVNYVEEIKGCERKPTINRAQLESIYENINYRSAIRYADDDQRRVYEYEAGRIDHILQRYLQIYRNEPAYDVFICYKESDENRRRTDDSVYATEIYDKLTADGLKVFFARVTLKQKLGEDYEPYIFAALNSAKVMIVLGTKAEYFNAVWVKNEWSRYMALEKKDPNKRLIPVYRNMDPYDMPDAFSYRQAQNMDDMAFLVELSSAVRKLVGRTAPIVEQPVHRQEPAVNSADMEDFLQRAKELLEDGDWSSASIFCDKALDLDSKCGQAHLYKLMAEAKVSYESMLEDSRMPLDNLRSYAKAVRFADKATTDKLMDYNRQIQARIKREEAVRAEAERERQQREMNARMEAARVRREQEEAERALREKARREEDFNNKRKAINAAISATNQKIVGCTQEREALASHCTNLTAEMKKIKKSKRKIIVLSLIVLFFAIGLFVTVTGEGDAGQEAWVVQIVLAILLAAARKKSKFLAFLFAFCSAGIIPGISAIRGLKEASKLSVAPLQQSQNACSAKMVELDSQIMDAKNELQTLEMKMQALNAEIAKANT